MLIIIINLNSWIPIQFFYAALIAVLTLTMLNPDIFCSSADIELRSQASRL